MTAFDVQFLSFFLPQFHRDPTNDRLYGTGHNDFRLVDSAANNGWEVEQPLLKYDLNSTEGWETVKTYVDRSKIDGLIIYSYLLGEETPLKGAIDTLASSNVDIPFALCWANEHWREYFDGSTGKIRLHQDFTAEAAWSYVERYKDIFKHHDYLQVRNRPLFFLYNDRDLVNRLFFLETLRSAARKLLGTDFYLVVIDSICGHRHHDDAQGADAYCQFPLHGVPTFETKSLKIEPEPKEAVGFDYEKQISCFVNVQPEPTTRIFGVSVDFNNSPRKLSGATRTFGFNTESLERWIYLAWLRARLEPFGEQFVAITAFNEWGEGCCIEPSTRSTACIEAVARAIERSRV